MVRSRWRRRRRAAAAAATVMVATAAAAVLAGATVAAAAAFPLAPLNPSPPSLPLAARQDAAEAPVPAACAGGAAPGARVCVDTDVHVAAAVGGTVTRFDVEDALVTAVYPAVAAATGLSAATDMGVRVDTPPAGQLDGTFLTLRLLVAADTSDAGVAAVSAAGVRGFREGVVAGVAGVGGVEVVGGPTVVGQRVAPGEGGDDAAGAGGGGGPRRRRQGLATKAPTRMGATGPPAAATATVEATGPPATQTAATQARRMTPLATTGRPSRAPTATTTTSTTAAAAASRPARGRALLLPPSLPWRWPRRPCGAPAAAARRRQRRPRRRPTSTGRGGGGGGGGEGGGGRGWGSDARRGGWRGGGGRRRGGGEAGGDSAGGCRCRGRGKGGVGDDVCPPPSTRRAARVAYPPSGCPWRAGSGRWGGGGGVGRGRR
ncbi:hypothetical protein BU14_0497s0010 [Porphyra umbilicalis]|uniref:Uncharacterized protein n=1 Tax=Porphyra umbilicalis TaxID=2786 RepID=A0A1X6NTL5_PORUM|nr:hypothetical protein BU14_0497s0010 [Porphyra umbilicalis]|eukprot:OSX71846.1 hypothetical protein BU14_0497s0010 [Porphyra umbilicalis]